MAQHRVQKDFIIGGAQLNCHRAAEAYISGLGPARGSITPPPPGIIFSHVCRDLVTGIQNNALSGKKKQYERSHNQSWCTARLEATAPQGLCAPCPCHRRAAEEHRERRHGSIGYRVTATTDQHG